MLLVEVILYKCPKVLTCSKAPMLAFTCGYAGSYTTCRGTKSCWVGYISGGARPRQGKIKLKSCWGCLGEEKHSTIPPWGILARNNEKFVLARVTSFSPGANWGYQGLKLDWWGKNRKVRFVTQFHTQTCQYYTKVICSLPCK